MPARDKKESAMSRRTVWRLFLFLVVGVVVFAAPLSAAADDGGGSTDGSAQIAIPGIFSLLMGAGGATEGGALALGPMELDLASMNSTAKVEGLTFGNGEFDWDAVTITQKEPSGSPGLVVSDAQATVRGPSTGYTSNATAHVKLQPSESVQGEGIVGVSYDGLTGQVGVMLGEANLAVNTPDVGVEVRNLSTGVGSLSADEVILTSPATGGGLAVSGLQVGSSGTNWQGLTVFYPEVQLGDATTLSDLTLIVHGPDESYGTEGSVRVEVKAGDLGSVEGQIALTYDPSSGEFHGFMSDGSATLATDNLQVQMSGISYVGSTLTIDTVSIAMPALRLEGEIAGVTMGGGNPADFEQAWVRYLPDPAAGGSFNGVQVTLQKVDGSYLITTQTLLTPVAKE
jgi:hypothetical protein